MKKSPDHFGKSVLVGIRHLDAAGNEVKFEEFFGLVETSSEKDGILLRRSDGQTFNLPPVDLADYLSQHDTYQLVSQHETVSPDFVVCFDVEPPTKQ